MSTYLIVDDDGVPQASLDMDKITDHGVKLAFRLAAARDEAGRQAAANDIAAQVLAEVGPDAFGYIAACALTTMARDILHPVLDCADAAGVHLRPGIEAIAAGRDPLAVGSPA